MANKCKEGQVYDQKLKKCVHSKNRSRYMTKEQKEDARAKSQLFMTKYHPRGDEDKFHIQDAKGRLVESIDSTEYRKRVLEDLGY